MKKVISFIILTVMTVGLFTGCVSSKRIENAVTDYPATVLNVTIERKPATVVSLSPAIAEMLIELGYGEKLVGYPDGAELEGAESAQTVGTGLKPDYEKIGELAPEVIFTNTPLPKAELEKLTHIGIKVVVMPVVKSVEALKTRYVDIITVMEGQIAANNVGIPMVNEMTADIDYIKSLLPSSAPSFLYITDNAPIIATGDTFENSILSIFGVNLAQSNQNYTVTDEELATMSPEMIFFANTVDVDRIRENELLSASPAVQNSRLYSVSNFEITLQSKDIVETVRSLAQTLYPDTDFSKPVELPAESEE